MGTVIIGGRLVAGGGLDAGEITVRAVPASDVDVDLPLNDDGTIDISVNLPMVDPVTKSRVDLTQILIPGRDFLGVVVDDVIMEAGPVWDDPFDFPHRSRIVANGLWSYFDHRFVLPVLTSSQLPRDVTSKWTGLSLRTIAKRAVQQACAHPNSALPIDYEADITGTHEREVLGSDMKPVGEFLRDLTEVENGPDITFRPKWGSDRKHVRWDLLTGNRELKQAGDDHYWDVSVPDAHATVVSLERDGGELSSRDFQIGATIRNLWANASFENDLDGVAAGTNANTLVHGTLTPFHGRRYAGWSAVAAGRAFLSSTRTVAVEPGEDITLSAYVRSQVTGATGVMIRFINASGATIVDVYGATVTGSSAGWVRPFVTATIPAGTATCNVHIFGTATAGGQTFAADAVMLTNGAELYPFAVEDIQLEARSTDTSLLTAGFPLLESSTSRTSVVREPTLQAYANESAVRSSGHMETWQIEARRGKHPKLGTYWPGDYAKVRIGKNARVDAGTYRVRIVGIQFGKTGDVSIQCAPERIVSGYPIPSSSRTWFRDKLRALNAAIAETTRRKK